MRKMRPLNESVKKFISRQFEHSLILKAFSAISVRLFGIPGRTWGVFSLTWSAYVILIALIKRYSLALGENVTDDLWCGIIVLAASVPLLFAERPLCTLCSESPLFSAVLTKIFGIPSETLKVKSNVKVGQSVAVIFGIVLGLFTYVISPVDMILFVFGVILIALIMTYPEGGVLISIALAPFLGLSFAPSKILAAIVLLTALAYGIKVIRGKRVLRFGVTEFAFTVFWVAVLLGGFAPGSSNTLEHSLLCCSLMLIFPLTLNLMKYRRWIGACVFSFVFPTAIVSFIGIAQYCLGFAPYDWLDESLFSGISSRTVSLFNNPNILGAYLVLMFPLVLLLTLPHNSPKLRVLGNILSVFTVLCTTFTFSRSAWLALLAGGVIFAVMISPKGILLTLPGAAAVAGAALLFPESIGARIKNFVTLADSANNYRVEVWNSSWKLLADVFAGGIGMGEEAFRTAYIAYASPGTQYAMHSHSLFMQIAVQLGITGLLLYFVFIFTSLRKCASSLVEGGSDEFMSGAIKAAVSGVLALQIAGLFDYTWYNYRVFFMSWALIGFACAAANLKYKSFTSGYPDEHEANALSVTVPINKRSQNVDFAGLEKEVINNDRRDQN